jgi:molybdenum cofactor cytidylyltransferase
MKFGGVPIAEAHGAVLAHGVRYADGVFKKGRVLSSHDIATLEASGIDEVVVASLDTDDVGEDIAARALAIALAGQGVIAQQAFTGRANLHSSVYGLVVVDRARANAINHIDESLTLATLPSHQVVVPKQMLATVKVIPFAVHARVLQQALNIAGQQPLLHVRLFQRKHIGLVITTVPQTKPSVVAKSESSIRERLQILGLSLGIVLIMPHHQDDVEQAIRTLQSQKCDCILVFGASAIVDRNDVIPAAVVASGGEVVHLGMPVDPGNLLLLARLGEIPVIGVPSCARSPKRNGFDWILERALAGILVTREDIMDMGVGGLLAEIPSRPSPREQQFTTPRVVAVVLAAGLGRRMGGSKMLAEFNGKPLVVATVENVQASGVDEVIVVTGHECETVAAALAPYKVRLVYNPDYASGMASSLRVGIAAAPGAEAIVICLGDMPGVSADVIDRLIAAFNPMEHRSIVVPTFKGQFGNPVLWGAEHFSRLKTMQGDKGARHLIGELKSEATEVATDEAGVVTDADTPEALAALQTMPRGHA